MHRLDAAWVTSRCTIVTLLAGCCVRLSEGDVYELLEPVVALTICGWTKTNCSCGYLEHPLDLLRAHY